LAVTVLVLCLAELWVLQAELVVFDLVFAMAVLPVAMVL
jgi:hypothetical protein